MAESVVNGQSQGKAIRPTSIDDEKTWFPSANGEDSFDLSAVEAYPDESVCKPAYQGQGNGTSETYAETDWSRDVYDLAGEMREYWAVARPYLLCAATIGTVLLTKWTDLSPLRSSGGVTEDWFWHGVGAAGIGELYDRVLDRRGYDTANRWARWGKWIAAGVLAGGFEVVETVYQSAEVVEHLFGVDSLAVEDPIPDLTAVALGTAWSNRYREDGVEKGEVPEEWLEDLPREAVMPVAANRQNGR